jgi:hypothetical protein
VATARTDSSPAISLVRFFVATLVTPEGQAFFPAAYAARNERGSWDCWIAFFSRKGRSVRQTGRESTQPAFRDAEYWASGLETMYLRGALQRARSVRVSRAARARYREDVPRIRARLAELQRAHFPITESAAP